MSKEKIYIISNESIYADSKNYFCDNLDMKSIPEGLSDFFDINIILVPWSQRSVSTLSQHLKVKPCFTNYQPRGYPK